MADPAAELQRQLQLLAKQFRQRLQRELPELSRQANALDKADNESARLPLLLAIRQQLHKLAGSAGTFGFTELGEQARPPRTAEQQLACRRALRQLAYA